MMATYFQNLEDLAGKLLRNAEKIINCLGDIFPVIINPCNCGPGKVTAISPYNFFSYTFIIAIENVSRILVIQFMGGLIFLQNKFFKKPGTVTQVPFRRRDINDWLHHIVFYFEKRTDFFCAFSGFFKKIM